MNRHDRRRREAMHRKATPIVEIGIAEDKSSKFKITIGAFGKSDAAMTMWGILAADFIQHVSLGMAKAHGVDAELVKKRMLGAIAREMVKPTSPITGELQEGS